MMAWRWLHAKCSANSGNVPNWSYSLSSSSTFAAVGPARFPAMVCADVLRHALSAAPGVLAGSGCDSVYWLCDHGSEVSDGMVTASKGNAFPSSSLNEGDEARRVTTFDDRNFSFGPFTLSPADAYSSEMARLFDWAAVLAKFLSPWWSVPANL
jgi:hypothetical protein